MKRNQNTKTKEKSSFKSEAVILEPLQVTIESTRGDYTRLVKKFIKKVRNEETLKPYYDKMAYFISKSEKKRQKLRIAKFEEQKRRKLEENS